MKTQNDFFAIMIVKKKGDLGQNVQRKKIKIEDKEVTAESEEKRVFLLEQ